MSLLKIGMKTGYLGEVLDDLHQVHHQVLLSPLDHYSSVICIGFTVGLYFGKGHSFKVVCLCDLQKQDFLAEVEDVG